MKENILATHAEGPVLERRFGGYSLATLILFAALLAACLWGAWATTRLLELSARRVVTVRLAALMGEFVEAEARSGRAPEETKARIAHYLGAVEKAVDRLGEDGTTVLVAEAVVAGGAPDLTDQVRAEVTRTIERTPHGRR